MSYQYTTFKPYPHPFMPQLDPRNPEIEISTSKSWLLYKSNLYWICQIGGWGLFMSFAILRLHTDDAFNWRIALDTFLTVASLLTITHFFRRFITKWQWLRMLFGKLFPRLLLASVMLSMIALPLQIAYSYVLRGYIYTEGSEFLIAIIEGAFLFFFWQVAYFLYHYVNNYNRNLKLEAMINEFELNKLKSQLNPHFIFNALNSVKALVDEDPDKAKDSIYQLSSILRSSLMMDKKKVIDFEEELSIVENYLALEATRFEERLQTSFKVDSNVKNWKVPPMMLQTLVENGIKHGISKYKDGGIIELQARLEDGYLHVYLRNTGQLDPNHKPATGYGLRSTLQRLELLYDTDATFAIKNEGEKTVLTELILPRWNNQEPTVRSNTE